MTQPGVSHIDESRTHRAILGLRVSALVETLLFLAVALLVDSLLGAGDRFSEISPHPFWIIVLLVSTYYGTNEGLATAASLDAAPDRSSLWAGLFDLQDTLLGSTVDDLRALAA